MLHIGRSIVFTIAVTLGGAVFDLQLANAQEKQEKDATSVSVLQKLKNGSIRFTEADQALIELNAAIAKDPDADWSSSIVMLAGALSHNGDFDKAVSLAHDRYRDRLSKARPKGELSNLLNLVECITKHCGSSSRPNLGDEVIDEFVPALQKEIDVTEKPSGWLLVQLTKLVGIRCQSLESKNAIVMLMDELIRAEQFRVRFAEAPNALSPFIEVKKILAVGDFPGGKVNLNTVDDISLLVEEAKPKLHKVIWGMLLYDTNKYLVQNLMFDHPEKATELMRAAIEKLETAGEEDAPFKAMFDFRVNEFKGYSRSIKRYKESRELIGTKAVEFESVGWVNGKETTLAQQAGRVVLLDFTAVWCGPCIQLIPELNAMQRELSDKGLTIFSVTDQYDFIWDKTKNMATKSEEPTSLQQQIELQEGFVAKHKQRFPVMIAKKNADMFKAYGVGSIPHAVLIDRKGIIRDIIIGNTEAGKRRLRRNVRKLLTER